MRMALRLFTAVLLFAAISAAAPLRILIITGDSDYPNHDWRATTPFLQNALMASGRFDVRVTEEPRGLTTDALAGYDAVLLNYNGPRWGALAEKALETFIRSGKGMVALHGVSYGPLMGMEKGPNGRWVRSEKKGAEWPAYKAMLGVDWEPANIGHAARHAFPVKLVDREHPITRGMEPEFTVNDELYHKMSHRPGIHVLAAAFDNPAKGGTGKDEPIAWTVAFGKGRVFHCTLGHDTGAMYQPEFLTLFLRATEWAATGEVTLGPRAGATVAQASLPVRDAVRVLVVTGGHAYEPSFYTVFEGHSDMVWTHAASQKDAFRPKFLERFDVLVLYDMANDLADVEKKTLEAFVKSGKGVVSLHHAIIDYTEWPWWWQEVVGGKYFAKPLGDHGASQFKDDVPMVIRPAQGMGNHPVVRGLGEIVIEDEAYKGMWHSPRIKVLMETDSPLNDRPVVYIGPNEKLRVIYVQLGHGPSAHRHPSYRKLVHNAILWSAGKM